MDKILVPTDFSEQSKCALDFSSQVAELNGSSIILLNVIDYPGLSTVWMGGLNVIGGSEPPVDTVDETFINNLIDKSKEELASLIRNIKIPGLSITPKVLIGNPYFCITEEITNEEIDIIVMGAKGISGLEEILIGSTTEKVVRLAKCPVITVKQYKPPVEIRNIVYASDFEEEQDYIVEQLIKMQKLFKARLNLVKVNTPNNFQTNALMNDEMKRFITKYNLTDYTINLYNEYTEEDGITHFAEEINADMIALATHGRTGLMHLLSGSIAEDVVNHAKRPVWTCRIKK
jgi:nucleotide-binding universal stress UspA family protein